MALKRDREPTRFPQLPPAPEDYPVFPDVSTWPVLFPELPTVPGGGPLRRGSRVMLRALAPGRVGAVAAVVVLLVAAAGLGLVSQSSGFSPAWWPLIDDPFGWAVTRW